MASLSRVTPSIFAGSNELTLALANLNFDFSLVKYEAPVAFQPIGAALSKDRRINAETGSQHVTARKLGALFHEILPRTPQLLEAYGKRASEIATSNCATKNDYIEPTGFFSNYSGFDGTSIWAAATSGDAAMSVHLLACMLAKLWSPSEAISIWVELVETRKKQIAEFTKETESAMHISLILAANIELSREQLAEWDNSARAWLRRGEEVKNMQQTQFVLICSNLNLPVNVNPNTFDNVIMAWKDALKGMENLFSGQSQQPRDGSLLLALSSWHLYPDIIVFGNTLVEQHDALFPPGARVILGLEGSPTDEPQGVYWCLPLAHLRYYGDPEITTRNMHIDSSRLTINQLSYVVLGLILSSWGSEGRDIIRIARILGQLYELITELPTLRVQSKHFDIQWFLIIGEAASNLTKAQGEEKDLLIKLVQLGFGKRAQNFLGGRRFYPPFMMGIGDYKTILNICRDNESRLTILRYFASARVFWVPPEAWIIRYRDDSIGAYGESDLTFPWIYATAVPQEWPSRNFKGDSLQDLDLKKEQVHCRWALVPQPFANRKKSSESVASNIAKEIWAPRSFELRRSDSPDGSFYTNNDFLDALNNQDINPVINADYKDQPTAKENDQTERKSQHIKFKCVLGDPVNAVLLVRDKLYDTMEMPDDDSKLPLGFLEEALKLNLLDAVKVISALNISFNNKEYNDFSSSFAALSIARKIYGKLGELKVTPTILARPIHKAQFFMRKEKDRSYSRSESLANIFSCISYFDGGYDIPLHYFENVIAVSFSDSIFVARALINDPLDKENFQSVSHIMGNVGKHGIALLVPTPNPKCSEIDLTNWMLMSTGTYNGKPEDNFKGTSLSLSFTGWTVPVDLGVASRGHQDNEARIYETKVSVHYKEKWIAELDPMKALSYKSINLQSPRFLQKGCSHDKAQAHIPDERAEINALNSWEDFLDQRSGPSVTMSYRNTPARLALTSLAVEKHDKVVVLDEFCWDCYRGFRLMALNEADKTEDFMSKLLFIC